MTYLSAAIAPPSPWIGRSCHLDRSRDLSDRCRHRRGDDRDTGAGADADADGDCDLPHREAPRGERDDAAREREDGDDLAARALEEIGERVEGGVERRVSARERRARSEEHTSELQSLMRIP